jgi:hypothetical protein
MMETRKEMTMTVVEIYTRGIFCPRSVSHKVVITKSIWTNAELTASMNSVKKNKTLQNCAPGS